MEITKITEVAGPRVIQEFEILSVDIDKISLLENSFNLINYNPEKLKKITAVLSDTNSNILIESDKNYVDCKSSIVFNEMLQLDKNCIHFLKNKNKWNVLDNISITYSTTVPFEQMCVGVIQPLELFIEQKNITIKLNEDINTIKLKYDFSGYISESYRVINDKVENYELNDLKKINLLMNPITLENNKQVYFSPSLDFFKNINLNKLNYSNTGVIQLDENNNTAEQITLRKLKQIIKNYKIIISKFRGLTSTEKEEFNKNVWNDTNAEDYLNYEFNLLTNFSTSLNIAKTLIQMCSGFLKSRFNVDGGYTNNHKNILPFYFDYINDDIYLKSEFYEFEIKNKKINILNSKINYYLDRIKSTINPVDIDTDLNKLNENNQKYLTYFYSDNFNFIMPETPQEWTIPQRKTFWMNPEEFETLKGKEGRISEYSSLKNKVITKEYIYAKAINYFRENNINNYAIKAIEITPVIYEFNKRVKPSEQILWNTLKNNPGNIQNYLSSFTNIEESQGKKLENTSITLEIGAHMSRVRVETPAEMYSTHITLKLFYATVIYSTYEENNKKISSFITLPAIDIFGITGNTLKTLELNNSSKLVLTGAFLNKYLELEDANSSEIIKIMKTTDPAKSCQLIINNIYI